VGAAGYDYALDRPVGKPHAVVGAHIVDGEEAIAKVKNRQASAASDDWHPATFGEVG